jgi:isohexenylglutaconyl-CoA hydratase
MLEQADGLRVPLIAALEGSVLGGGLGLACVSDIAIAAEGARFGLPETGLGLTPAQIAPFVTRRIGLTQARRLAVTGLRVDAMEAQRIGIIHQAVEDADALTKSVYEAVARVMRGAPGAIAETKRLMRAVAGAVPPDVLDRAALDFAGRVRGEEGKEGMAAFGEKRAPAWMPVAWRGEER